MCSPSTSYFYPRPPRGGRQDHPGLFSRGVDISIHALREEGDLMQLADAVMPATFLSTPSARRATRNHAGGNHDKRISIHALREEGDRC